MLSLCLHALLVWLLLRAGGAPIVNPQTPTEITIVENDTSKAQTFVTETESKDVYEKLKEQADYLSQFTKRVQKQIKARRNDRTQNLNLNPATPSTPAKTQVAGMDAQKERGELNAFHPHTQDALKQVAIGVSSIAEHIPGIEEGAFTALNTDQFTYYAFFNRINEQIRNRWISGVRGYMGVLTAAEQESLSKFDRQTVIEIILTRDGRFSNSVLHKSSGDRRLDMTTVEAFRSAAPFLNPPTGLIESDGTIRLKYGFLVRFRPPNFGPASE